MLEDVRYEGQFGQVHALHPGQDGSSRSAAKGRTTVPCFTAGTLIATPRGEIPVEDLRPGDRVLTRDSGLQEILWTGRRDLTAQELRAQPELCPVRIAAGSLGHGLPERDLLLSPNHRILIRGRAIAQCFQEEEVLVAAQHNLFRDGFTQEAPSGVGYIHLLFARHEILLSNGAWSESFRPGPVTLAGMDRAQRDEILHLFPELGQPVAQIAARAGAQRQLGKGPSQGQGYPAARRILNQHEAYIQS